MNPKLGVKYFLRTNLGEKTKFGPYYIHMYIGFILSSHFVPSFSEIGPQ
jgi:hypothetical protein